MSLRSLVLLSAVGICVSIAVVGCPPPSTSKAVLAGTWELTEPTSPNPELTKVLLTFDANGDLTTVTYVFAGATVTSTAAELNATTSVSGSTVTITSTFGPGGNSTLNFTGTLNSDNTVINGTSSFTIVVNSTTTITFATGTATLTKQTSTPTPKTVLAGTWELTESTSPSPDLTEVLLTFDANGDLTTVTYVFAGATVISTAAELNATTSVSGSTVTITSTFGPGGNSTLDFTGTLNTANTVITGTSSFTIVVNDTTTVIFPTGNATLTKVTTPITGNAAAGQTLYTAECLGCHPDAASLDPNNLVNDLGTLSPAMAGIILTDQEIADLEAYLATL